MEHIPDEEYQKIVACMPIVCVDVFVVCGDAFLLGKRKNEPAKGEWFTPGGRVLKGETLKDAAMRKLSEELGVAVGSEHIRFLLAGETIFKGLTPDENRHSVNIAYRIDIDPEQKSNIRPDLSQQSEVMWFHAIDLSWHPYVQQCVKQAGFFCRDFA